MVADRVKICFYVRMEHTPEAWDPVDTVRRRVKELRGRKGWTGAELGERMTQLGVPWDRSIVANFENGRRQSVTVSEAFALALVFEVAPVNLLVPLDDRPYRITPERTEPSLEVRAWIRGQAPLPGMDPRLYFTEVAWSDLDAGVTKKLPPELRHLHPRAVAKRAEQQEGGEHGEHREET